MSRSADAAGIRFSAMEIGAMECVSSNNKSEGPCSARTAGDRLPKYAINYLANHDDCDHVDDNSYNSVQGFRAEPDEDGCHCDIISNKSSIVLEQSHLATTITTM